MLQITKSEYEKLHTDFRGVWTTERWDDPNWERDRHLYMGKRTMLHYDNGTCLLIEGLSFEITDDTPRQGESDDYENPIGSRHPRHGECPQ